MRRSDRHWREDLKDLFALHAGERRGVMWLLVLCCLALVWVVYEQWWRADPVGDAASLELTWAQLDTSTGPPILVAKGSDPEGDPSRLHLFHFDPNDLPVEQWVLLGLSERQADAIHKFEARGGRFRTKADLAKMFVVKPALFAQWQSFIDLPDSLPRASRTSSSPYTWSPDSASDRGTQTQTGPIGARTHERVEVNTADTAELVAVPGIGPAFARGIVKYRERLGGFHSLDQLSEVYVLRDKPDAVARIREKLFVDEGQVHRFALNTFTAEELGPHPYAGWKLAKALVAYRKQHGPFRDVADIKGCVLVTDSVYRKLAPYLTPE
jgi:DNA uptake protein ComE-like DNA-binding protein